MRPGTHWRTPVELGLAVALAAAAGLVWGVTGGGYFWPRWVWFGLGTALAAEHLLRRALRMPAGRRRRLAIDAAVLTLLVPVEVLAWALSGGGFFWPVFSLAVYSAAFGTHAWIVARKPDEQEQKLAARVDALARTRRGALDEQAAELKRIERDLHDGAQARMVSLALSLGMAEDLVRRDPDAAVALLAEARSTAVGALDDLRTVMSGIAPAVLADRGLSGGIRALALDIAVPVTVVGEPRAPLPPAVESAAYFAVAECLANVVKHSGASRATVVVDEGFDGIRVVVTDDGRGGADLTGGSGLQGIATRLESFDGGLTVDSPAGGPTAVTIEIRTDENAPGNARR